MLVFCLRGPEGWDVSKGFQEGRVFAGLCLPGVHSIMRCSLISAVEGVVVQFPDRQPAFYVCACVCGVLRQFFTAQVRRMKRDCHTHDSQRMLCALLWFLNPLHNVIDQAGSSLVASFARLSRGPHTVTWFLSHTTGKHDHKPPPFAFRTHAGDTP